jgi:hypothetical protein
VPPLDEEVVMRARDKLRITLTFAVVLAFTLETLHWLQPFAVAWRASSLPWLVVGKDGDAWFRRFEGRPGEKPDEYRQFAVDYGPDGRVLRETERAHGNRPLEGVAQPSTLHRWGETTPGARLDQLARERFRGDDSDWADRLTWALEQRGYGEWRFRNGRLACTNETSRAVLGSIGPDGWTDGEPRADAERFNRARVRPAARYSYSWGDILPNVALVDPDRRAVRFIAFDPSVDVRAAPIPVRVTSVRVEGSHGEPPAPLPVLPEGADSGRSHTREADTAFVRAGADFVAVGIDGALRRTTLDPDESEIRVWSPAWKEDGGMIDVVTSLLPPLDPARPRMRVRTWRGDGSLVVRDVRAPLATGYAVFWDVAGHSLSLFRPPLVVAASFAAPGPSDFDEYSSRWLLDSDVAGGADVGWFAASLGVAAVCGAFARRRARLASPTPRAVLAWTVVGASLGVVGLVLQDVLIRRSHVEACACGRRRAVRVAACPACAAEWPAPSATGVEVFA